MSENQSFFGPREARFLVEEQCACWELAHNNIETLDKIQTRELSVGKETVRLQYNPARILSSTARIDESSLQARPCFLCASNRPPQQMSEPFDEDYEILVNPYPILPYHLTIPTRAHTPQRIARRMGSLFQLCHQLKDFVVFYNGPRCGASAPDHAHFQAGATGVLPMENEPEFTKKASFSAPVCSYQSAALRAYPFCSRPFFEIRSTDEIASTYLFSLVLQVLQQNAPTPEEKEEEPMMNLLAWNVKGESILRIFPRQRHRPACYYAQDADNILLSPGALDMGGLVAVPRKSDFENITGSDLETIFSEVCIRPEQLEELARQLQS